MKQSPTRVLFDVSWSALFKILALGLALWVVFFLRDVLIMLFVVFIFVGALNPLVTKLQKWMTRTIAVFIVYLCFLLVIATIFYIFVPPLITQINDLSKELPNLSAKAKDYINNFNSDSYSKFLDQSMNNLSSGLKSLSGNVFDFTLGIFGGLATFVTGLVLSFYLLLEEKNARNFFNQILPKNRFEAVYTTFIKISDRIGSWVRGQLLLMGLIAAANLIVFTAMRMPSPLPLALWSGICELVPYIGPLLGLLPALLVTLLTGHYLQFVLIIGISYMLIQQLQGHFVVPKVMSKAVGLSPVLVILALTIGAKMYGLLGALIAIPSAAVISVIVGEWHNLRKLWEKSEIETDNDVDTEIEDMTLVEKKK